MPALAIDRGGTSRFPRSTTPPQAVLPAARLDSRPAASFRGLAAVLAAVPAAVPAPMGAVFADRPAVDFPAVDFPAAGSLAAAGPVKVDSVTCPAVGPEWDVQDGMAEASDPQADQAAEVAWIRTASKK